MPTTILDNESYLEALQRRYVEESKNEENMKLIQMAEEACSINQTLNTDEEWVKRFAALVAAHEAEKWKAENKRDYENWKMAAEKAAECEREACAKVCEDHFSSDGSWIASVIRSMK